MASLATGDPPGHLRKVGGGELLVGGGAVWHSRTAGLVVG